MNPSFGGQPNWEKHKEATMRGTAVHSMMKRGTELKIVHH